MDASIVWMPKCNCTETCAEVEAGIRTQRTPTACGASEDPPMFMRKVPLTLGLHNWMCPALRLFSGFHTSGNPPMIMRHECPP